jgi:hypothetical protein
LSGDGERRGRVARLLGGGGIVEGGDCSATIRFWADESMRIALIKSIKEKNKTKMRSEQFGQQTKEYVLR